MPLRSCPGFGIVLIAVCTISSFAPAVPVSVGLGDGLGVGLGVGLGFGLGVGLGFGLDLVGDLEGGELEVVVGVVTGFGKANGLYMKTPLRCPSN